MIDLNLYKNSEKKDNPYWPDLVTEAVWESSNCRIVDEFIGGISSAHVFHVFYQNEEIGSFRTDFSKSIIKQIKDVFLAKFPNMIFNR